MTNSQALLRTTTTIAMLFLISMLTQAQPNPRLYTISHGAILRGDSTRKTITLVFTGDEFADGLPAIDSILHRHHIRGSFFFTGRFYRNPAFQPAIRHLYEQHHNLGPHSNDHLLYADWTRRDCTLVTADSLHIDFQKNLAAILALGVDTDGPHYFIPPYEWWNDTIAAWCQDMGWKLINFTPGIRTNADYTWPEMGNNYLSSEAILKSLQTLESSRPSGLNGSIVLIHAGTDPRRTDKLYNRLGELLGWLQSKGYQCVPLPELLPPSDLEKVRNWRLQQETVLLKQFMAFLAIPNVASDTPNIRRNATFIQELMRQRNIANIQLLSGNTTGYPPAVYGEFKVPGATKTIGLYAHYDGQPVNPAQWSPGLFLFTPVLRGDRIYARGASDDKAGIFAILNAFAALEANNIPPTCNIRFLFEGEEEAGSIHLGDIFQAHAGLLTTDCWIICDGPVHQSGRKQIVFGVRGDTRLDLTVYGPKRPLHSGHYGNWANNPALMLVKLLASMKNDSGRVTIDGFYDDVQPLSPSEKKALAEVPSADRQMMEELGFQTTEMKGKNLTEAINLPSLNINGIQSGNVGAQASNQIPTFATAVLDLRLVLGNDWKRQQQKVIDHIRRQGFTVLDHDPTDAERRQYPKIIKVSSGTGSYNAQRTSMDLPVVMQIKSALQSTTDDPIVLQPTMGGSLPLYLFEQFLHGHTITVPIANHDNNQHAENENLRLANLWSGIESIAAIMRM